MDRFHVATYAVLGVALAISVATDLHNRTIKNIVTYPTFALCAVLRIVFHGWGEWSGPGLFSGLLGALLMTVPFLALRRGFGEGDFKLNAAVGMGLGLPLALPCLVFVALAGAIEATFVLVRQGKLLLQIQSVLVGLLRRLHLAEAGPPVMEKVWVPYGVAIAAGTVWSVYWSLSPEGGGLL